MDLLKKNLGKIIKAGDIMNSNGSNYNYNNHDGGAVGGGYNAANQGYVPQQHGNFYPNYGVQANPYGYAMPPQPFYNGMPQHVSYAHNQTPPPNTPYYQPNPYGNPHPQFYNQTTMPTNNYGPAPYNNQHVPPSYGGAVQQRQHVNAKPSTSSPIKMLDLDRDGLITANG